jgi:hypothetical protein
MTLILKRIDNFMTTIDRIWVTIFVRTQAAELQLGEVALALQLQEQMLLHSH